MALKTIHRSGKRKSAIAKATLNAGTGKVKINNVSLDVYEPKLARLKLKEPLILAGDTIEKVNISLKINGGGTIGQAEAGRLALARCLVAHNKKLEKKFHDYDRNLLVADVRRKETCKPNDSKARAKRQKSYR